MSDHGFDKTDLYTSRKAVKAAANEISKESGVVAVHIVEKVGAEGHYSLITLCDKVLALEEVIPEICAKHSVDIKSRATWHSVMSFRNGKETTNAFI